MKFVDDIISDIVKFLDDIDTRASKTDIVKVLLNQRHCQALLLFEHNKPQIQPPRLNAMNPHF